MPIHFYIYPHLYEAHKNFLHGEFDFGFDSYFCHEK